MLECNRFVKKKMTLLSRTVTVLLVIVCIIVLLSQTAFAKNTYLINDGNRVLIHTTYATDPAKVLGEAGLELGIEDTYTTQSNFGLSEITVQRKQTVTVIHGSKTLKLSTYGETIESLLSRAGLILTPEDMVSFSMTTPTYDGMVITISRALEREETYTALIPHGTAYCYDASLADGEEVVLTPGVDGQLLCSATVSYVDGKETGRTVHSQVVTRQPVDEIVAIGTYIEQEEPLPMPDDSKPDLNNQPIISNGTIVTPDGEVLTYTQKLDCIATAYSCNGEPGITYSGTPARIGAIAVDPTVIPLGTRMYVVTNDGEYIYGICTAEDIGGSIKGNKVDLYFNTFDECWIFGIRDCAVYILG